MTWTGTGRMAPRLAAIGIGLIAGAAILVALVVSRNVPERGETAAEPRPVRYMEVQPVTFALRASGYGEARPADTWTAVANVAGRVIHRHPDLADGNLIEAGTELLRLDPGRYQLAIREARAELATLNAERAQLDGEADNIRGLLELEEQRLALAEQELTRTRSLHASGDLSATRLDEQRRLTLQQEQAVLALRNELALVPPRRQRLDARVEQVETRLEQAREDLEDTRFTAPFNLRVGSVQVELHEHAGTGRQLFQADSIEATEVVAHVRLDTMRRLVGSLPVRAIPEGPLGPLTRLDLSALGATVHLAGDDAIRWPARVVRVADGLDPRSRTARVVVEVQDPYLTARPPDRPPLVRDMYVRVHLTGGELRDHLVVPAAAVHQGEVHLVDDNNRLLRRPVRVAFRQRDLAVIDSGLGPGDRVILDDVLPAVGGLPLAPRRDREAEQQLEAAAGRAP